MERHFNVTVYIFDPKTKCFLMIKHRKLGKWLPPGGHIDPNEIPDIAAAREALEETGIKIKLFGDIAPKGIGLVKPFGIQRNIIEKDKHEHLDIIYLAFPKNNKTIPNFSESEGLEWLKIKQIEKRGFNTFPLTKKWCRFFYDLMMKVQ